MISPANDAKLPQTFLVQRDAPLTGAQIEDLRVAVGWDRMAGRYDRILVRAYSYFSISQTNQLLGFVNVISDGIGDAFLVDLMVHPDFQRVGIGRALVIEAVVQLKADGLRCIQVIFEPELEAFYQACGFHILKAGIIDTAAPPAGTQ
jgi:ribosomal protein S18 acetylase RimI-like enzyme